MTRQDVEEAMAKGGPPDLASPTLQDKPLKLLFDFFSHRNLVSREKLGEMMELIGMPLVQDRVNTLCEYFGRRRYDFSDFSVFVSKYWEISRHESLASIFGRFRHDGEVHKDALKFALEFMNMHAVQEWIDDVVGSITKFTTLAFQEFLIFVTAYWERQQDEYARAYRECDEDGSGSIEIEELGALLSFLGIEPLEPVIQEIFAEVDEDGSGSIELPEFQKVVNLLHQREGFTKTEFERLMNTYATFDSDKSGTLDMEEVLKTLEYLHYSLSEYEARAIFQEIDVDKREELSEHEYLVFMRKVREHELFKIQGILNGSVALDKEEVLVRLITGFGRMPDADAVKECAKAVGIDLHEGEGRVAQEAAEKLTALRAASKQVSGSAGAEEAQRSVSKRKAVCAPSGPESPARSVSPGTSPRGERSDRDRRTLFSGMLRVNSTSTLTPGTTDPGLPADAPAEDAETPPRAHNRPAPLVDDVTSPSAQHLAPVAEVEGGSKGRPRSRSSTKEMGWKSAVASVHSEASSTRGSRTGVSPSQILPPPVTMGEAWRFLEYYRGREGLTEAQLMENKYAFDLFSAEGTGQDTCFDETLSDESGSQTMSKKLRQFRRDPKKDAVLRGGDEELDLENCSKALRWLGWTSSHELFMQMQGDVDLDSSGEINLKEFHKLIRMYNEREIKDIQIKVAAAGISASDYKARVQLDIATAILHQVGFSAEDAVRGLRKRGLEDAKFCDVFQLISVARSLGHAHRRACRRNEGFTHSEVIEFREVFAEYTETGKEDHVHGFGQSRLLSEVFPQEKYGVIDWKKVLKSIPGNHDEGLTFSQFLRLRRMWRDFDQKQMLEKEERVVEISRFTLAEVRDFRRIFVAHDVEGKDFLDFYSVKALLQRICPMGDKLAHEFKSHWVKVLRIEHGKSRDAIDFPEFLLLMRQLLEDNFAGIKHRGL